MKRRQGFTLVELMVSMALIIFMMAILSQAFIAALSVFRDLKAQGDLAEKLRATSQMLQSDLAADHFAGGKRLSDKSFWLNGPPAQGFFRIWQGNQSVLPTPVVPNPYDMIEGSDIYGLASYISTDHYLAFTIKKRGNDMGDFFSASAAGGGAALSAIQTFGPPESRYQLTSGVGAYNYQWAEVAWFLQPQINPTTGLPDTTVPDPQALNPATVPPSPPYPARPLYTLYRRQRLLVPDNSLVQPPVRANYPLNNIANFQEASCWANSSSNNLYFNNPVDITVPWRRFGMVPPGAVASSPAGLLYATTVYPPSAWPVLTTQGGTWTLPSPTPPTPQTYPPSPTFPFLPPFPNYPTMAQVPGAPLLLHGSDIQLNDVISFDVRVCASNPISPNVFIFDPKFPNDPFVTLFSVAPNFSTNVNTAFYNSTTNQFAPAVFDTWTSLDDGIAASTGGLVPSYNKLWNTAGLYGIPMWSATGGPLIKAIQVTIRIWDFKTNQTRQVTIVQAM